MKATYNDFLKENPNCSGFAGCAEMILIFERLSNDSSIIAMIEASDDEKPALMPCSKEIEDLLEGISAPTISFKDGFTKQAVGRMVKTILAPFGYEVWKQKDIPASANAKHFTSAMVYRRDPTKTATMAVVEVAVKVVVEVNPITLSIGG